MTFTSPCTRGGKRKRSRGQVHIRHLDHLRDPGSRPRLPVDTEVGGEAVDGDLLKAIGLEKRVDDLPHAAMESLRTEGATAVYLTPGAVRAEQVGHLRAVLGTALDARVDVCGGAVDRDAELLARLPGRIARGELAVLA